MVTCCGAHLLDVVVVEADLALVLHIILLQSQLPPSRLLSCRFAILSRSDILLPT